MLRVDADSMRCHFCSFVQHDASICTNPSLVCLTLGEQLNTCTHISFAVSISSDCDNLSSATQNLPALCAYIHAAAHVHSAAHSVFEMCIVTCNSQGQRTWRWRCWRRGCWRAATTAKATATTAEAAGAGARRQLQRNGGLHCAIALEPRIDGARGTLHRADCCARHTATDR